MSIITAKNVHKDEINRLGALCFAEESEQILTDFYSEDSCNVNIKEPDGAYTIRLRQISPEIQNSLWSSVAARSRALSRSLTSSDLVTALSNSRYLELP